MGRDEEVSGLIAEERWCSDIRQGSPAKETEKEQLVRSEVVP